MSTSVSKEKRIYGYIEELVESGTRTGRIFGIGQEIVKIGRGSHNHIRLNARIFSRLHATITIKEENGVLRAELTNQSQQNNATTVDLNVLQHGETVVLGNPSQFKLQGHSFKWTKNENDGNVNTMKSPKAKNPVILLTNVQTYPRQEGEETTQDVKNLRKGVESPSQATPTPNANTESPKRRKTSLNVSLELRKAAHRRSYRSSTRQVRQSVPLATLAEAVQEDAEEEDRGQSSDLILFSPDTPTNNIEDSNDNTGNCSMITHAATPPLADKSNQTIDEDDEEEEEESVYSDTMEDIIKTPVQRSPARRASGRVMNGSIVQENIKPSVEAATATPQAINSRSNASAKKSLPVEGRRSARCSELNSSVATDEEDDFSDTIQNMMKTPVQKSPAKRVSEGVHDTSTLQTSMNVSLQTATPGSATSKLNASVSKTSKVGGRRSTRSSVHNSSVVTDGEEDYSEAMQDLMKTPTTKRASRTSNVQELTNSTTDAATPELPTSRINSSLRKSVAVEGRRSGRFSELNSSVATDAEDDFSDTIQNMMKTPVQKSPAKRVSEGVHDTSTLQTSMNVSLQTATPGSATSKLNASVSKTSKVGGRRSTRSSVHNSSVVTDGEDDEDSSETIQDLMKTPATKRASRTSNVQELTNSTTDAATPELPTSRNNSSLRKSVAVEGGRSARFSELNSSVATDAEDDFSDTIQNMMKTPVQKSPAKRVSEGVHDTSTLQTSMNVSLQTATPGSATSKLNASVSKTSKVGGRRSTRSSVHNSGVVTDGEEDEDYSETIQDLMKTPTTKRASRTSNVQELTNSTTDAATPELPTSRINSSLRKSVAVEGRRSGRFSELNSSVATDAEDDFSDTIQNMMKTPVQKSPAKRVSEGVHDTSTLQTSMNVSLQTATPGSATSKLNASVSKTSKVGGRRSTRSSVHNSGVVTDGEEDEDYSETIQDLMKTPTTKRASRTSNVQEVTNSTTDAATPELPTSRINSSLRKSVAVEGGRSARFSELNSSVATDAEDDFSDTIQNMMKTPVQKSPAKRVSEGVHDTSTLQTSMNVSLQTATPGSATSKLNASVSKTSKVGGRRSTRSSVHNSSVVTDGEEDYSEAMQDLMKTPTTKRASRTSNVQEVTNSTTDAATPELPTSRINSSLRKSVAVEGRRSITSLQNVSLMSATATPQSSSIRIPKSDRKFQISISERSKAEAVRRQSRRSLAPNSNAVVDQSTSVDSARTMEEEHEDARSIVVPIEDPVVHHVETPVVQEPTPKRGRPKKIVVAEPTATSSRSAQQQESKDETKSVQEGATTSKRRGRGKATVVEPSTSSATASATLQEQINTDIEEVPTVTGRATRRKRGGADADDVQTVPVSKKEPSQRRKRHNEAVEILPIAVEPAKRSRRGKTQVKVADVTVESEAVESEAEESQSHTTSSNVEPTPKRRGRKKTTADNDSLVTVVAQEPTPKRGRPKKVVTVSPVAQEPTPKRGRPKKVVTVSPVAQELTPKRGRPKKVVTVSPVAQELTPSRGRPKKVVPLVPVPKKSTRKQQKEDDSVSLEAVETIPKRRGRGKATASTTNNESNVEEAPTVTGRATRRKRGGADADDVQTVSVSKKEPSQRRKRHNEAVEILPIAVEPAKRSRRGKTQAEVADVTVEIEAMESQSHTTSSNVEPTPKRRGRKKTTAVNDSLVTIVAQEPTPKRGRPKNVVTVSPVAQESTPSRGRPKKVVPLVPVSKKSTRKQQKEDDSVSLEAVETIPKRRGRGKATASTTNNESNVEEAPTVTARATRRKRGADSDDVPTAPVSEKMPTQRRKRAVNM